LSYTKSYDNSQTPPAPVANVTLTNPNDNKKSVNADNALVDSGADLTQVPRWIAEQIELMPIGTAEGFDYENNSTGMKTLYSVRISFGRFSFLIRAVETTGDTIIGRNVINQLQTILRGPQQTLEML